MHAIEAYALSPTRLAINPNVGEFWMLIDARWVSRWAAFVLGQAGPPGPISNRRLFGGGVFSPWGPETEDARGYAPLLPCELPRGDR